MKNFVKQILTFRSAEVRALALLSVILLVTFFIPKIYERFFYTEKQIASSSASEKEKLLAFSEAYDAMKAEEQREYENRYTYSRYNTYEKHHTKDENQPTQLFPFDPNTLSVAGWQQLGLSEKQAIVIDNYRKKGGKFRQPEDIKKIFVIKDELKEKLLPYVRIAVTDTSAKNNFYTASSVQTTEKKFDYESYKKAKEEYQNYVIDINTADSAAFEKLKWVGAAMAGRIVRFREEAGGFYSIRQLSDIWGMNDSIFINIKPHLKITDKTVKKININKADYETLRRHPYIRGNIAKWAISYRRNNNGFKNVEQFARVPDMNEETFKKLLPYLTIE